MVECLNIVHTTKELMTMKIFKQPLLLTIVVSSLFLAVIFISNSNVQLAPKISFNDIDGNQHTLSQYTDKPVLMIFWATDCPGCIEEMPQLNALYQDYADQGLTMIGVAMAHDSPEHISAMRMQRKLSYILTWDKNNEIVYDTKELGDFSAYLDAKNMRLFAKEGVSDLFLNNVGKSYEAMFRDGSNINQSMRSHYLSTTKDEYVF